jgi:AraC-like DNA-binding protein
MPEEFRPILLEDFEIHWPGYTVLRVALNQHMPRVERLSEHVHPFHQALVYLRGFGVQHLDGEAIPVKRGSVLAIPSGLRHRFVKERQRRPVCLAIDFETGGELPEWEVHSQLTARDLASVERLLVSLHEEEKRSGKTSIVGVSFVLQLFALVGEVGTRRPERSQGPIAAAVLRTLDRIGLVNASPGAVARELGVTLDHLNRQLQGECGSTVGGFVRRTRLEKARQLLRDSSIPVGDVGSAVGIDDRSYFARWFRQHAGQSPTHWREAMRSR